MKTFVALLRGINVGGKNILPMQDLVAVLEDLGLSNVQTYIQSGNVVFQTTEEDTLELAESIGSAVQRCHAFTPKVVVLPLLDFRNAVKANPFPEGETKPSTLHLFFLKSHSANPDEKRIASLQSASEKCKLLERVFYLHAPEGVGRSKLAANVEKILGVDATARNWRTVHSILEIAKKME